MNAGLHPNPVSVLTYARSLSRLLVVVFAVLLIASATSAQTSVYTIRGNAGGNNNIWNVNLTTGVETLVYIGYPGGNAATLAQRPSDGVLFYSINGTNGAVYSFNPATPNVAPVLLGTVGAAVSGSFRMAFNGATLYYMIGNAGGDANRVYTINQATGAATTLATVTNTNNGGDMAFLGNTLYVIDQDLRLCSYAGLPANGAAGGCNTIGVPDNNSIGLAFNASGQLILQTVTNANLYSVSLPGLGFTAITGLSGGNTATGDMASANVPAPNLAITKSDGVTTVYRGGPVTYTIVVTNSGTYPVTGTVTDTVPATVTGVTWTCVASPGSSCGAASGSGNTINTTATLEAGDTATYTVSGTIAAGASGTLTNTANVAVPVWLTDSTPANNTATDVDTINLNANLGITKTDSLANINSGSPVTYTVVVSNAGPDASTGSIVTDTVPASITGVTWTCGGATGGATCGAASGSGNSINTTANLPSGSSVTYTVSGTLSPSATGTLSNTATVITPASGVSDPNDLARTGAGNNSATDTTTINAVPDLRLAKSHSGNFTVGVNGTYTLTASNAGSAGTSGTITVVDNLPAGLTIAAIPTGTGWNCSSTVVGSSTATCTSVTVIAAGATSPNLITVTVVVAPAAFPSVTNSANISGGNEPASNNGNNSVTDPTTVNGVSDLTIAKTHVGNFTQGQVGATYSITATNSGTLATSGTVTVVDTLPAGLTATAISGTGWACVLGTLTCTRSDALAPGASYPVITLTVTVANNAPASVTNSVAISGGGEPGYNNGNNTGTNPTTINQLPDLTINKSHVGNFTQGQVGATYSITATNSGSAATSGTVTVVDTLPAGLTATAISGAGWSCVLGTLTCTRSDALAAGSSYPVITVTVNVANNAPASVTNSVSVSGGGQTNTTNDTATNPTTINQLPDLTITKTHVGNFTQGQVGATYSITATNSGSAATSGTVTVVDTLPAGLTATAISGTGWSCVLGTLTCTRSDALAAGSSYPVITVTVTVANNAPASVTNSVTVSGGGQTNTTNDAATNPTTINQLPDLTITKSHVGNFTQGQVGATYSITATNSGFAATSGTVTVVDTLPAGLTATAISGTGWSCVLGTLTCTRSDALTAGASYPVITVTVNVALSAPATVTNSASVSGGGQTNTTNDTANDLTNINAAAPPSIGLVKSVSPGGTQIPGTDLLYTIVYTNTGGQPANNFILIDPNPTNAVPAERVFNNVDFKVGSLTSNPGSSGLVAAFQYSNDGGASWIYTPISGGGGAAAGYDRNVTNIRWSFAGSLSQTGPNNTGSVTLTVRIR